MANHRRRTPACPAPRPAGRRGPRHSRTFSWASCRRRTRSLNGFWSRWASRSDFTPGWTACSPFRRRPRKTVTAGHHRLEVASSNCAMEEASYRWTVGAASASTSNWGVPGGRENLQHNVGLADRLAVRRRLRRDFTCAVLGQERPFLRAEFPMSTLAAGVRLFPASDRDA